MIAGGLAFGIGLTGLVQQGAEVRGMAPFIVEQDEPAPGTGQECGGQNSASQGSSQNSAGQDAAGGETCHGNEHPGILRFHVVANSDSARDQALKLKVRDYVLTRLGAATGGQSPDAAVSQDQAATAGDQSTEIAGSQSVDAAASRDTNAPPGPAASSASSASAVPLAEAEDIAVTRAYVQSNLPRIEAWAREALRAGGCLDTVHARLGVTWIPQKVYDGVIFPAGYYEALHIVIGQGQGQNWWCVLFPPLCYIDAGATAQESRPVLESNRRLVLKSKVKELLTAREAAPAAGAAGSIKGSGSAKAVGSAKIAGSAKAAQSAKAVKAAKVSKQAALRKAAGQKAAG